MTAQSQGKLKGVHGRLGDQGSIPQKYDTAISSCCPTLDFIVVDSIKDAEACVNFLRSNNIGKASFIGLDKMRNQEANRNRQFNTPQSSQRLFDLIQSKDEKFLNAFYFAIKDTLVADDIKIGTHVAFNSVPGKTFRVVTLTGDIVESSGVMSGGGKARTGAMSNKLVEEYSEEQVRAIVQQIETLERQLGQLKSDCDKFDVFQAQIQQRIQQQQQHVHRFKSEFDSYSDYHRNLVAQSKDLHSILSKVSSDQALVQRLTSEITKDEQSLQGILPKIQKMTQALQTIESQILEVGGSAYKKQKSEIELQRGILLKEEKQYKKLKQVQETSEASVRKMDDEISESESKIIQITKDLEDIELKIQENE